MVARTALSVLWWPELLDTNGTASCRHYKASLISVRICC